ncbi:MAG: ATP-binding protein, partial [Chlamydiia bacterium]|nr:ATP-binding protein [Chlamydiia bacterium]
GYLNIVLPESTLVEACVASHCKRLGKTFYFKGQGEIDVVWLHKQQLQAIEVKWANQLRPADLKSLKHFKSATILGKNPQEGQIDSILSLPVYRFLFDWGQA